MKRKTTKRFAAASLSLAFAVSASWAETTEAAQANMADEVHELDDFEVKGGALYSDQITALKTPTPILDVPQSLTVTTAEEISLRGFNSVQDIVDYTPGVNMSQGEGHRDAVVFRGVRSTADFFVDGVRDDVQYYRPLYNVEQVEILRGPNALFFGRGGAGGILNRVTKKGEIGENFNAFSGSIDTFGGAIAEIDSNVTINETTAVRINAYYESFENDRDYYDGDAYGVNPTAKFLLSEKTTLDLSYEYLDHERFIDRGIPTGSDFKPVDRLNGITFGDSELNESTLEAHTLRALLQHQFSDELKANLTASYTDFDKVYQNLYTSSYSEATTPDRVTLDGYLDTTDRQSTTLSSNLIGEFETGDIEHTLIVGAEYVYTESDQDRYNAQWSDSGTDKEIFFINALPRNGSGFNVAGDPTTVNFNTDLADDTSAELNVYSIFIQDEIQLFDELTVVLGGRFDSFDIDVTDNEAGGTDGSQKDEEFTPRAGIVYKPVEDISIYASYSETFVPQSGEQYANLGNDGLDPNEYTNLEAGVKWDFAPGYSVTAAIFQIEQDIVESDNNDGSRSVENEINGFEAQFSGQITDDWFVTAGYSYLEGELDGTTEKPEIDGNDPRELPEHMFSIWNYYRITEKLSVGLGAIYQDESYITEDNDTQLPDFWRVDAAAYYQINQDFRLQINVENLLDEEYYPSAHADHQATVGDPIHATFKIVGRF